MPRGLARPPLSCDAHVADVRCFRAQVHAEMSDPQSSREISGESPVGDRAGDSRAERGNSGR